MSSGRRKYQSRIRQRPCDSCRQHKVKCKFQRGASCVRCIEKQILCVLPCDGGPVSEATAPTSPEALTPPEDITRSLVTKVSGTPADNRHLDTDKNINTRIGSAQDSRSAYVQALIQQSSEIDPKLSQYLRLNHATAVRLASGGQCRPAHEGSSSAGECGSPRSQVLELIPIELGTNLLRLFFRHVFSFLPVVSFTDLELGDDSNDFGTRTLHSLPVHLLSAIYASALPFLWDDNDLALWFMDKAPPINQLWQICYDTLIREIHHPRLDVLRAGLLYIQRQSNRTGKHEGAGDSQLHMGTIIGLSYSLDLHQAYNQSLSSSESSQRRNIYWVMAIEDQWMSLMHHKQAYVRMTDSGIPVVCDDDYPDPINLQGCYFRDLTTLSLIADKFRVELRYGTFRHFEESLATANAILESLGTWRQNLPLAPSEHCLTYRRKGLTVRYPAVIYTLYLTLQICIWRELIHSLPDAVTARRDPVVADSALPGAAMNNPGVVNPMVNVHSAAIDSARSFAGFVLLLEPASFSEFWYSWSCRCFTIFSHFLILLVARAPSEMAESRSKELAKTWLRILDYRYQAFPVFREARESLGYLVWGGLDETIRHDLH